MLAYRFYCRRYSECKLLFCKDMVLFKELFTYAGSDMIGVISVLAQGQGLNLLLNIFLVQQSMRHELSLIKCKGQFRSFLIIFCGCSSANHQTVCGGENR